MAAQSAAVGAGSVVQGAGQPQWRPSQEDDHRGAGAQAAGGAVEICDCRRRHRGRHCEERLKGDQKKLKQSTGTHQSRWICVDEPNQSMASNAVIKNGLVLLSLACRKRDIGAAAWRGD